MSIKENIISVALRLTGGAAFDAVAKSAEELRGRLNLLPAALARGDITADQYARTSVKLAAELARLQKILDGVSASQAAEAAEAAKGTAATRAWAAAAEGAASSGSAWGAVLKSAGDASAIATANILKEAEALRALAAAQALAASHDNSTSYELAGAGQLAGGYELAHVYDLVEAAETRVATSARAAGSAVEAANTKAAASTKEAAAATRGAADAAQQAQSRLSGMNQALRGAGYGISDIFSNNGPLGQKLQGFANNVGGITTGILQMLGKIGPGGIIAAAGLEIAVTAVGSLLTAMKINSVEDFFNVFKEGSNAIPESTDDVKRFTEALEKTSTELDQLREKTSLSNDELARFNELTEREIALEKEKEEAAERKKEGKAYDELKPDSQRKQEAESKKSLQEDLGKGQEDIENDLAEGLRRHFADEGVRLQALANTLEYGSREQAQAIRDMRAAMAGGSNTPEAFSANRAGIKEALAHAAATGDKDEIENLRKIAAKNPKAGKRTKEVLRNATPEAAAERRNDAADDKFDMDKEEEDAERDRKREEGRLADSKAAAEAEKKKIAAAVGKTGHDERGDLRAEAKDELVGGADPAAVKAKIKAKLMASLNAAGKVDKAIREAVAESVSEEVVSGIDDDEVARAKAAGETRAKRLADKADAKRKHDQAVEQRQSKELADHLSGTTDVDERAAALVAGVRGSGGAVNPETGEFRPMNAAQQQAYIRKEIFAYLRRIGVGAQQAQQATGPIAAKATGMEEDAELASAAPQPPGPKADPKRRLRVVLPPGLSDKPSRKRKRKVTPDLKPGARSLAGPGSTRKARETQRDAGIAATDARVNAQTAKNMKAVGKAKNVQDARMKAQTAKNMKAVAAAKADQDAKRAARVAHTKAGIDAYDAGPPPAAPGAWAGQKFEGFGGGRPQAPAAPGLDRALGAAAAGQDVVANGQAVQSATLARVAQLEARWNVLQANDTRLLRAAGTTGYTSQNMST